MDSDRSRKISKLYRKIVTSDEVKALLIYKGLDRETKEELHKLMQENSSPFVDQFLKKSVETLNKNSV